MTDLRTEGRTPSLLARWAIAVVAALSVPFVVTGLFRFEDDGEVVVIVCAIIGVALLARRGMTRAAGVGWLVGGLLYALLPLWLLAGLD